MRLDQSSRLSKDIDSGFNNNDDNYYNDYDDELNDTPSIDSTIINSTFKSMIDKN